MNDFAFCKGNGCPQKDNCWRYVAGMNARDKDDWFVDSKWDGETCGIYMGN